MTAFDILGLEPGATAIEIKRAYARAVKRHRPDTDAEGFQRVTEAYEECLAYAAGEVTIVRDIEVRMRPITPAVDPPRAMAEDTVDESEPPPTPPDEAPTVDDHARLQAFLAELESRARSQLPATLGDWLRGIDDFYSLNAKGAAADAVVEHLDSMPEPLSPAALDVVLVFFNLESVNQPRYWLNAALTRLRSATHGAREFESRVRAYRLGGSTPVDRMLANEVLGPRNRWRSLLIALVPGLPRRVCAIRGELLAAGREYALGRLDVETLNLWLRATDLARFDVLRLAMVALRLAGAYAVLWWIFSYSRRPELATSGIVMLAGAWGAWAVVTFGFVRWQRRTSLHAIDGESLALLFVALLLVVASWTEASSLRLIIAIGSFWTGQYAVRPSHDPPRAVALFYLLMAPLLGVFCAVALDQDAISGMFLGAGIALAVMVGLDEAYARRHDQHVEKVRVTRGWLHLAAWAEVALLVALIVAAIIATISAT